MAKKGKKAKKSRSARRASGRKPTHADAELMLKLYDLRREAVMRQSRDAITFGFWPRSWDDVVAIQDLQHPMNAAFRQVGSYWEMVYGLARKGIAEPEFLVENNGEGLLLYCKLQPWLHLLRQDHPTSFQHSEWVAENTETGGNYVSMMKERFAEQLPAQAPVEV